MQVSINQLLNVLSKMKYSLAGYKDDTDIIVSVETIQADPGTGVMLDCLTIKATAPKVEGSIESDVERSMVAEVFPASEKLLPKASKIETFTVSSKY